MFQAVLQGFSSLESKMNTPKEELQGKVAEEVVGNLIILKNWGNTGNTLKIVDTR